MASDSGWQTTPFVLNVGACGTRIISVPPDDESPLRRTRTITYANGDVLTTSDGSQVVTLVDENSETNVSKGENVTWVVSGVSTTVQYANGARWFSRTAGNTLAISDDTPESRALARVGRSSFNFSRQLSGAVVAYTAPNARIAKLLTPVKVTDAVNICDLMDIGYMKVFGVFKFDLIGEG